MEKIEEKGYIFDRLDRPDGIVDSARVLSRVGGGVGEGFGDGVIFHSRKRMYGESRALARWLCKRTGREFPSVLFVGGGACETAITLIACAMLGGRLTLAEEMPDGIPESDLVIAPCPTDRIEAERFVALDELAAAVMGESLSADGVEEIPRGEVTLRFITPDGRAEEYSEREAILIARAYARAEGLMPWDTVLSTLAPTSREGFFGGVLAPMLSAREWVYARRTEGFSEQMRLTRPTRLLCGEVMMGELYEGMKELYVAPSAWQKGKGSHPLRRRLDRLFPRTRAAWRRLRLELVHYPYGGRLSGVTVLGRTEEKQSEFLAEMGVLTSSVISSEGCALAGYRRWSDERGFWRLPRYLCADMREVGPRGYGRLTFFVGGEEDQSIPSDLVGFPTRRGRFFVCEG